MFDIGWQEVFIVATIAIVVIGPKDLPNVLRAVAKLIKRARKLVREFQSGLDEVVREAGVDEIRENVERGANFDIGGEIEKIIDPEGDVSSEIDMGDIERELDEAGSPVADKDQQDLSSDNDGGNILSDAATSPPNKTNG